MITMTTRWLADTAGRLGYEVIEGRDTPITGGSADSRTLRAGDLFAAHPGEHTDGNRFVGAALAAGAPAVICNARPAEVPEGSTVVVAPSTREAAGRIAAAWRRACDVRVIGITGTVGKTSTKEMIAAVLGQRFATHKSAGNLNSLEGLPLALLTLTPEHEVSVLEMGIDAVGEMQALCAIAEPDAGSVLNIGLTHVSKLGSIENTAREKLTLPRSLPPRGTAILNLDDARVAAVVPELACRVIGFGRTSEAALRVSAEQDLGLAGSRFTVEHAGQAAEVSSPLPGVHLIPAAMSAIAAAMALGVPFAEAAALVSSAHPESRMRTLTTARGVTILDDRYNSSPASLAGALRLLGGLQGRRLALLGKMAELGDHERDEHRQAGAIAAANCDAIYTFGPLGAELACGASAAGPSTVRWFPAKEEAATALAATLGPGDTVLVKGSRSEALETVLPLLGVAP